LRRSSATDPTGGDTGLVPAVPAAPATTAPAPQPVLPPIDDRAAKMPAWVRSLLVNAWVPLALLGLVALGHVVEDPERVGPYHARILILIGINISLAVSLQLINGVSGQFSLGHAGFMAVGAYLAGYATKEHATRMAPDESLLDFANPAGVVLYFVALGVAIAFVGCVLYGAFFLMRLTRRIHALVPTLLLLAVIVWFVWDVKDAYENGTRWYHAWTQLFSAGGKLFSWIVEFGHGAAARISGWVPASIVKPIAFLVALIGGGAMAALAGFVVGLPTLRLRGDYLAIATLGFAEIIRVAIANSDPLGGATGLSVPVYWNPPDPGADPAVVGYYIFPWVFGLALITTLVIWRIKHSPKGRAILAVREDEVAAAAVGVDTTHHKVVAFVIGAFFAGAAGGVYAHYDGYLNANSFGLLRTIELVVMVTLGGLGNIAGAVIAAIVLTILPELLRVLPDFNRHLPDALTSNNIRIPQDIAEWRMVIYALLLVVLMQLRSASWFRWPRVFRRRATPGANPPVAIGAGPGRRL
jgi:branched-chain amino acid transport system permease protein